MKTVILNLAPTTATTTGLASTANSSGIAVALSGSLTSGGVFTSPDGLGRIITILETATSTQSDVTFTLTGTDTNNDAISEVVTGPASGATVVTTKYFKTVSSIAASAAQGGAETVSVGIRGTTLSGVSKVVPINFYDRVPVAVGVAVTGTINFTVQQTFDEILTTKDSSGNIVWEDISALASKTATTASQAGVGAKAVRLVVNTYSTGATAKVRVISTIQ